MDSTYGGGKQGLYQRKRSDRVDNLSSMPAWTGSQWRVLRLVSLTTTAALGEEKKKHASILISNTHTFMHTLTHISMHKHISDGAGETLGKDIKCLWDEQLKIKRREVCF